MNAECKVLKRGSKLDKKPCYLWDKTSGNDGMCEGVNRQVWQDPVQHVKRRVVQRYTPQPRMGTWISMKHAELTAPLHQIWPSSRDSMKGCAITSAAKSRNLSKLTKNRDNMFSAGKPSMMADNAFGWRLLEQNEVSLMGFTTVHNGSWPVSLIGAFLLVFLKLFLLVP